MGFYGISADATRNTTALLMAELEVGLSWRWMYWFYVPIALLGMVLVHRYFRPDRPPRPVSLPIDWLAVTLFAAWVVAVTFGLSWYCQLGGWAVEALAGAGHPLFGPPHRLS